jgi:hypothetical protein
VMGDSRCSRVDTCKDLDLTNDSSAYLPLGRSTSIKSHSMREQVSKNYGYEQKGPYIWGTMYNGVLYPSESTMSQLVVRHHDDDDWPGPMTRIHGFRKQKQVLFSILAPTPGF